MTTSPPPNRAAGAARPRSGRSPWSVPLAVVLVLVGVFATGAGLGRTAGPFEWATTSAGDRAARGEGAGLTASRPVRLSVPTIGIAAPVEPVGQARDGSIGVPPLERADETGWYDRGPTPGEPGPAVIVGHVDTKRGPSVFHDLHKLRPGDTVEVTRADRSVVVFRVDSVEHFPKDRLPADRVYGDSGPPGLRLITCGGDWLGGRTGYADNVIAFATLQSSREP
ncbi:class F sortase [Micromonospora endolithica]|uniref:Class F sortase n=1 Tax=Micromonospora endolithica TaxID=230091 RepID=A0A3A9ZCE8_9ACTN|nr:class F sortase [Micromonospora endolithica]RKN45544.1 class F sortase [Micromonospora endolithica]TWJ22766.1 sortase family protein [Micromonospora endolithica]